MKKDSVKYIVLIVFSLATLVLLILNAVFDFNVFWTVNISDGIEIFVLIFQTVDKVLRETSVSRSIFLCVYEIYSENRKFSLGLCHP